jgi:hypothetical protein
MEYTREHLPNQPPQSQKLPANRRFLWLTTPFRAHFPPARLSMTFQSATCSLAEPRSRTTDGLRHKGSPYHLPHPMTCRSWPLPTVNAPLPLQQRLCMTRRRPVDGFTRTAYRGYASACAPALCEQPADSPHRLHRPSTAVLVEQMQHRHRLCTPSTGLVMMTKRMLYLVVDIRSRNEVHV